MATVNKNTLAGRLAEKTNLSQKDAGRVLNALFGGKLDDSKAVKENSRQSFGAVYNPEFQWDP